jgi:hypothetical protein
MKMNEYLENEYSQEINNSLVKALFELTKQEKLSPYFDLAVNLSRQELNKMNKNTEK